MSIASVETLREAGLRITQPRRAVLHALTRAARHMTAEEIHRAAARTLPGLAIPTVYAVLGDLVRAGLIREIRGEGHATVFDPNVDKHHHLICRSCARIVDVGCVEVDEHQACLVRPAASRGWSLDAAEVTFRGMCPDCRKKEAR